MNKKDPEMEQETESCIVKSTAIRRRHPEVESRDELRQEKTSVVRNRSPKRPVSFPDVADKLHFQRHVENRKARRTRDGPVKRQKRRESVKLVRDHVHLRDDADSDIGADLTDGSSDAIEDDHVTDDVDPEAYESRRSRLEAENDVDENLSRGFRLSQVPSLFVLDEDTGLKINNSLYNRLFNYQKEGVTWLGELHKQKAGAIIGDEMGLGKTAQVISFLAALHSSGEYIPSIVLCPVTLLRHWMDEIRKWFPQLRTCILHDGVIRRNGDYDPEHIIEAAVEDAEGILVTTYEHFRIYSRMLLRVDWGYAILDEGHKIKNPDADITLLVKKLRTRHRVIISGYPVQNRLTELWSLFDFIFPGKLGTLPVFETEFTIPIQVGGYKNASKLSLTIAMKCVMILRELIRPYMLIRCKNDVDLKLPAKKEHVLFCKLSDEQKHIYKDYIQSPEVEMIVREKKRVLAGIDALRKICNHPQLLSNDGPSTDSGEMNRSGKLKLTMDILRVWKKENANVLVFTQTQMMLDILERHIAQEGYTFHRMDGRTPTGERSQLIDSFNKNSSIFIFLLTTRVGGLGVNLTGANRVLLYDPDWNPSIDIQAKERVWRIGQQREVCVYRLVTSGTIEEKIYKRQIFKKRMTEEVVQMRSQRRQFNRRDIGDLFAFDEESNDNDVVTPLLESASLGEDVLLSSLLLKGAVKSATDESEEMEVAEDDQTVKEAVIAAKEAKSCLDLAAERRATCDVFQPTWTGRHGTAGAPPGFEASAQYGLRYRDHAAGVNHLEAPTSGDLLAEMQQKRTVLEAEAALAHLGIVAANETRPPPSTNVKRSRPENPPEATKSMRSDVEKLSEEDRSSIRSMIIQLFKQRGNTATTEQLKQLASRVDASKRSAFKYLLHRVASKSTTTQRWILDPNL